jgi:hypothetical protein
MNPKIKYMTYDFYAGEWSGSCGACGTDLFAPTKSEYQLQFSKHTHSDKCLGGY